MNNRNYKIILILIFSFFFFKTGLTQDKFNFDITQIEILEDGNKFVGSKRGKINSKDILIIANSFVYDKKKNTLNAIGKVEIIDSKNKIKIFTNEVTYNKSDEIISTTGQTKAIIQSKYNFLSKNVFYNRNQLQLSSKFMSYITDKEFNEYSFENFTYSIKNEMLSAKNINIINNTSIEKKDNLFFSSGFFNLKKKNFIAEDTKINFHKEIFGNSKNDPRLFGVSSQKIGDLTIINKGIFTSCNNKDNKCPPWSIKAKKITHDSKKKQITYDSAVVQIYDKPILYFPKFFHPDPSVKRQSGFLKPYINKSHILGSSIQIPYYKVLSENSDLTFKPIFFGENIYMFNNEYRLKNKHSTLVTDFALVNGYKSALYQSKKNIYHLFSKFNKELNLDKFNDSNLKISIERTSSDTYLKLFDSNLVNNEIKPIDFDTLTSNIELSFDHNDYQLDTGLIVYEKLNQSDQDRYQFVLPYYNFSKFLFDDYKIGSLNLNSFGDNILKDTNNLTSKIINDLNFDSNSFLSSLGFESNYKIYTKNLNTIAKNDNKYKSSPQSEISSILEFNSNFPLIKKNNQRIETLLPKLSLRFNPSDMINYSTEERRISVGNLFDINRLGLSDTLESGKSLTLGLDYKNESAEDINNYFELKLGGVFRDNREDNIPKITSLNNKSSNLFGSMKSNLNKNLLINYDFSIDNNFNAMNYNSITSQINLHKFNIEFSYLKENYENNNENIFENSINYQLDDKNLFSFKTRRNREINLTEFYDVIYEYKNDCLAAAFKYKKSFYEDRDVKPSEDLMFTITLFPISKFEQKFN